MKIVFIGGGNMAGALIGGLLKKGTAAQQLAVVEIDVQARVRLEREHGVSATADLAQGMRGADVVLFAIKPQQMRQVASALAPLLLSSQLVITIAAGIRVDDLSRWLGGTGRIIRVMPNTPALVLAGISALFAPVQVGDADRRCAEAILAAVGATVWVEREDLIDAVTALSGSGPGYVFYFMEAMMRAGEGLGLSAEQARQLTLETFCGAAALARSSVDEPALLRAKVTSKGGTTERAVRSMENNGVGDHIAQAVQEAAQRSRELGEQLGAAGH